jgi:hypothetical protein
MTDLIIGFLAGSGVGAYIGLGIIATLMYIDSRK